MQTLVYVFHFIFKHQIFLFCSEKWQEVMSEETSIHLFFLQLKQCDKCALEHTIAGVNVKAGNI